MDYSINNVGESSVPLGISTEFASSQRCGYLCAQLSRRIRYRRRSTSAKLLPRERVANCGKQLAYGRVVAELVRYEDGHAGVHGLAMCGSAWMCSVCAARISKYRADELAKGVDAWQAKGCDVRLVTFTMRHHAGQSLKDSISGLRSAYREFQSGRGWVDIKKDFGIAGVITALEVTYSRVNGWHPHLHVLMFMKKEPDIDLLEKVLQDRWLFKLGHYDREGLEGVACVVSRHSGQVAAYVSKWGVQGELTGSDVKISENLKPFQLLDLYERGYEWAGRLWVEYAKAMKGRRQLGWSRGLRDLLGLGQEVSDETIVEQEPEAEVIASFTVESWRKIHHFGLLVDLLELIEYGDVFRFYQLLIMYGIKWIHPHSDTEN